MLRAYLQKLKTLIEADCPFEVRIAHSGERMPEKRPFIVLGVKSAATDLSAAVTGSCIRYPVTAVISAAVYAPVSMPSDETGRILTAYVLPVIAAEKAAICGVSEDSTYCTRQTGCHRTELQVRIKGVYTVEWEGGT